MADKPPAKPDPAAEGDAPKKKQGGKTLIIVAAVMVVEAAVIVAVLSMFGPSKSAAEVAPAEIKHDDEEHTVEVPIVEDKFQNMQTGQAWIWDVSIYVQVKEKNAERVELALERKSAEIKEGVSQIFSRAQHAQLKEPERQSLNRQLTAYLQQVFGKDAEDHSLIERVLIPKCRGFPAEF